MRFKVFIAIASMALGGGAVLGVLTILAKVADPTPVDFVLPCIMSVLCVAMAILANAFRGDE